MELSGAHEELVPCTSGRILHSRPAANSLSAGCSTNSQPQGCLVLASLEAGTLDEAPVGVGAAAALLSHRAVEREQRKAEAEAHHHRQLWSKRPHGGPYYKVQPKAEAPSQALVPHARGQLGLHTGQGPVAVRPEDLLGYEVVEVGPTTNLVGDGMSRAAVDLVRAALRDGHGPSLNAASAAGTDAGAPEADGTSAGGAAGEQAQQQPQKHAQEAGLGKTNNAEGSGAVQRFRALWARLEQQGKVPAAGAGCI